jgi:hypothetical protein
VAINIVSSQVITRPADTTAYAAGDLIANSTTAGSVTPFSFPIPTGLGKNLVVKGARIKKSDASDVANSNFTIWLFGSSPVVANGDNGALSADLVTANFLGKITGAAMLAGTDDAINVISLADSAWLYHYVLSSQGRVYGLLEALAAYGPASAETFTIDLILDQS